MQKAGGAGTMNGLEGSWEEGGREGGREVGDRRRRRGEGGKSRHLRASAHLPSKIASSLCSHRSNASGVIWLAWGPSTNSSVLLHQT